jgi:hypothetical protein
MRMTRRRVLAVSVAVVLVIAAVVVARAFYNGCVGCEGSGIPGSLSISGTISVTSQSGGGGLSLQVKNNENNPVGAMAVSKTTPNLGGLVGSFDCNGAPINNTNPFTPGESASGQFNFTSGGVNGTRYVVVVSVTLTNGQVETGSTTIVSLVRPIGGPTAYYSGVSSDGLQLTVKLNSSVMQPKGALEVHILVMNTLNNDVSLPVVANRNISASNQFDSLCGNNPSWSLVGFALFNGHFSAGNITEAGSPLLLAPPNTNAACPGQGNLNSTTFSPNSDKTKSIVPTGDGQVFTLSFPAEVNASTTYCTPVVGGMSTCGVGSSLLGYWNPALGPSNDSTLASKMLVPFPSGEYTIVATDDWNQFIYAYFTVL